MAIDKKPTSESEKPKPLVFRNNLEVKKRIEAHKKNNPADVTYYTRLVTENPERAIETFLYRDMLKQESEMKLIMRQVPNAKAYYESQSAEVKARIDRAVAEAEPIHKDKALVTAVVSERGRQFRRELTKPGGTKMAA